jgi:hypothetical protein
MYYSLHLILNTFDSPFFLYSVKNDVKKNKRKRESAYSFIIEFRCCKLLLFTLLPFVPFLLYAVFAMTFTRSVLFSLSLSLWYSPLLTTTIRYARIIISTFYTHTFFIFSSYNTLGCAFVLLCFFFL